MIKNILDLLQVSDWHGASESIQIAKGAYRYPRTLSETIKLFKRWRSGK